MTPYLRLALPEPEDSPRVISSAERVLRSGNVLERAETPRLDQRPAKELFPGQGAMLFEAALLAGLPAVEAVFPDDTVPVDPGDRIERAVIVLHRHIGERARMLPDGFLGRVLALALGTSDSDGRASVVCLPMIDAATRPLKDTLTPTALHHLRSSLSLLVLAQSLLSANGPDALRSRRSLGDLCWACRALISGAHAQQGPG